MKEKPILPIPPPQTGDKEGTWAYYTLSKRFADTARRVILENAFTKTIEERLERLIDEIPDAVLRQIEDPEASDLASWHDYMKPYLGLDWRIPPWFTSEHYFYRRILEATGYYQKGDGYRIDPFQLQKRKGLLFSIDSIQTLLKNVQSWRDAAADEMEIIERLLFVDLWGNQADLSLWPAEGDEKPDHEDQEQAARHVLIDDSARLMQYLNGKVLSQMDILIDNAGFEFLSDLVFVDFMIRSGKVMTVRLHLKAHPTYVSDATMPDAIETIEYLCEDMRKEIQSLGHRLQNAREKGQLEIVADWFWNSPLDGWEMPDNIYQDFKKSNLIISKGDAHYRRLLGDRYWSFDTPFEDIVTYIPAPVLMLRTSKSELMVGLKDQLVKEMYAKDPEWLINGRWGVVQFLNQEN